MEQMPGPAHHVVPALGPGFAGVWKAEGGTDSMMILGPLGNSPAVAGRPVPSPLQTPGVEEREGRSDRQAGGRAHVAGRGGRAHVAGGGAHLSSMSRCFISLMDLASSFSRRA